MCHSGVGFSVCPTPHLFFMKNPNMETRVTALIVCQKDDPTLFSGTTTKISMADEAAGEYVVVEQNDSDAGKIFIAPEEWEDLKDAIDTMIANCRDN